MEGLPFVEEDRMMHSARRAWLGLGCPPLSGISPTGPNGFKDGGRWICTDDVIRCVYKTTPFYERKGEWDRMEDDKVARASKAYPRIRSVQLWDHQKTAISKCMPAPDTFRSGILDMDCGTGKSMVGVELVRRSRSPAVVVTQQSFSVGQWVKNFQSGALMENVLTMSAPL